MSPLPLQGGKVERELLEVPEVLAIQFGSDLEAFEIANTKTGLRTEWRLNANTGKLRGVAFRERNKQRKAVRYVGERSTGGGKAEYARYANTYNQQYEQKSSVGSGVDRDRSVGSDETSELIPLPANWPRSDRIA